MAKKKLLKILFIGIHLSDRKKFTKLEVFSSQTRLFFFNFIDVRVALFIVE